MFGRVRPATSSADDSLERTPSKIVKDHSLSAFENTLMKLKLGSKHQLDSGCKAAEGDDKHTRYFTAGELILADEDSSPTADAAAEDSFECKLPSKNNVSVIYLFSKYRRSREVCVHKGDTYPQ